MNVSLQRSRDCWRFSVSRLIPFPAVSTFCFRTFSTTPGAGHDLDLGGLIHAVQSPPFQKVGVVDLETFFPAKDRFCSGDEAEQSAGVAEFLRLAGR